MALEVSNVCSWVRNWELEGVAVLTVSNLELGLFALYGLKLLYLIIRFENDQ